MKSTKTDSDQSDWFDGELASLLLEEEKNRCSKINSENGFDKVACENA